MFKVYIVLIWYVYIVTGEYKTNITRFFAILEPNDLIYFKNIAIKTVQIKKILYPIKQIK